MTIVNAVKKKQGISIFSTFFCSIGAILCLMMFLLTTLTTLVVFTRLDGPIDSLLDRSLIVAWQEYNSFFQEAENTLSLVSSLKKISKDEIAEMISKQPAIDFWLTFNQDLEIVAGSFDAGNPASALTGLARTCITHGKVVHSSITLPVKLFINTPYRSKCNFLIDLKDDPGASMSDIYIENDKKYFAWVLARVSTVPLLSEDGSVKGCLLAGDIINNDRMLPAKYSEKIRDSYLTIGVKGVRVVSNIQSSSQWYYLGDHQHEKLVETIAQGQRYSGKTPMGPGELHLVASDPIIDATGNVIGALSVGIPSEGIATIKRDTFFTILLSLGVCLIIALITATYLARALSQPLASITSLTKNIADAEEWITPEQLRKLENKSAFRIREINHLQHYLQRMAHTIYQKSLEEKKYLAALESDKFKLRQLTDKLQTANVLLEKKVSERTSELRNAVVNLKAMDKMKTKFLANMSHELRTPLNSIIGFSEILHDETFGELNSSQKDYVGIILTSARDLLQIIGDILDLSRVEQGELSLNKGLISIEKLISSILTIVNPQINTKKQALTIQIEPELPALYADPVRIKQVLYNLLSNAHKFTPFEGNISITAGLANGQIKISVTDNGIGIKKEHQEHVFDEFYQSETLYESKYEGVGLGLPLSKKLVELHGGTIGLVSEPGKGTTVSFSLPVEKKIDL